MGDQRTIEQFATPEAFRAWLADHHDTSPGIWLKIAKKGSGLATTTYDEALEVALAFGWIDGQKRSGDDSCWLQGFTRRGPRSPCSRRNREKAEALIAAGERFASLNSVNRYAILYRIQDAKRPDTPARRIARFVDMLERGETLYPG
jgi:uncharacterized protein YdeI (YjbR/CyaY-like superfamily)